MIDDRDNFDFISSNVHSSRQEALLYILEDNEAVVKMVVNGRSPTVRRVSRTHRVAPDWLFDRINLDHQIQIKHVDTKNQLADILTKGNSTRDARNNLLHLCQLPRSNVENNAKRNRRRENCGKVEADVELGLAYCGKLFYSAEFECIKSSGDS